MNLRAEGGPGNVQKCLSVHFFCYLDLLQDLKGFLLGSFKPFGNYSGVQTLKQEKQNT